MRLTNYGQAGPAGTVSVGQALREARRLLHKIKGTNLHLRSEAANRSLKYVEELFVYRAGTFLGNICCVAYDRVAGIDDGHKYMLNEYHCNET
jgi:hypothetical protein